MAFKNFFRSIFPVVKADDEDLIDPLDTIRVKIKSLVLPLPFKTLTYFFYRENATRRIKLHLFSENIKNAMNVSRPKQKPLKSVQRSCLTTSMSSIIVYLKHCGQNWSRQKYCVTNLMPLNLEKNKIRIMSNFSFQVVAFNSLK